MTGQARTQRKVESWSDGRPRPSSGAKLRNLPSIEPELGGKFQKRVVSTAGSDGVPGPAPATAAAAVPSLAGSGAGVAWTAGATASPAGACAGAALLAVAGASAGTPAGGFVGVAGIRRRMTRISPRSKTATSAP